jgi:aspartyl/asparaginyl beta-hydroxylase (cupin superfamily)
MEKIISDSERSHYFNNELRDYFKVIVTSNVFGNVHTAHYAVRIDEVSSFMDSVYDTYNNDAVIQFNGIFQQKDCRFWFTMV